VALSELARVAHDLLDVGHSMIERAKILAPRTRQLIVGRP